MFILLMASVVLVPAFRRWPWIWLVPLLAYFLVVTCIRRLRTSMSWLRLGNFSASTVGVTVAVMALTTLGLVLFNTTAHPDVRGYRDVIPFHAMGGVIMAGIVFTIANATLEELVFRGVLFDALQSQWGACVTLIATGVLFGLGHLHGYPPGPLGACLGGLFGVGMGVLRLWSGGLGLPIIAHMGADATIYSILVYSGVV